MTYTATWYRLPHGRYDEPMQAQSREFDDLDKAVAFVKQKAEKTRGIYFAGAEVEDEAGNTLYYINMEYDETWHKIPVTPEENPQEQQAMATKLREMLNKGKLRRSALVMLHNRGDITQQDFNDLYAELGKQEAAKPKEPELDMRAWMEENYARQMRFDTLQTAIKACELKPHEIGLKYSIGEIDWYDYRDLTLFYLLHVAGHLSMCGEDLARMDWIDEYLDAVQPDMTAAAKAYGIKAKELNWYAEKLKKYQSFFALYKECKGY